MASYTLLSRSSEKTRSIARLLGEEIRNSRPKSRGAFFLAFQGDLGAGKTCFIQGLARGLGISRKVQSPTFLLMKRYSILHSSFKNFWHVDAYRVKSAKEFSSVGFQKIANDARNVIALEWADNAKRLIPKDALRISLLHISPRERLVEFRYGK